MCNAQKISTEKHDCLVKSFEICLKFYVMMKNKYKLYYFTQDMSQEYIVCCKSNGKNVNMHYKNHKSYPPNHTSTMLF